MAHEYRIKMTDAADTEECSISGEIPDNDWQSLLEFKQETDRMAEALKQCDDLNVNFTVNWNRAGELTSESRIPKERDVSLVLHRIRPFVLNDEPLNFNRMVNRLKRAVQHPLMERALRSIQELYSGRDFQRQSEISSGDLVVNSENALQAWLNSSEYPDNSGD